MRERERERESLLIHLASDVRVLVGAHLPQHPGGGLRAEPAARERQENLGGAVAVQAPRHSLLSSSGAVY